MQSSSKRDYNGEVKQSVKFIPQIPGSEEEGKYVDEVKFPRTSVAGECHAVKVLI